VTTIMATSTSDGERRCDSACHDAGEPRCDCICGGRFHGKGRAARELLEQDLLTGALGPELQQAAAAFMPPSLFDGPVGQQQATPEQWARARKLGMRPQTVVWRARRRFGPGIQKATDITVQQLAALIHERADRRVS
jgi:hypothetical protein